MMVILSAPLCLLCVYLAWLCYRRAFYKQTLVIGLFALLLLLITVGFIGASVYTWDMLQIGAT